MTTGRPRPATLGCISIRSFAHKERSMLMNESSTGGRMKRISGRIARVLLAAAVAALAAGRAVAQYPGGGGGMGGSGGSGGGTYSPGGGYGSSGKAIGIGVGAAAGAGLLFLAMHKGSVTGCVQPAEDGLRL